MAATSDIVERAFSSGSTTLYDDCLRRFDELLLVEVLTKCRGNRSKAARLLGRSRVWLRQRLRELGVETVARVNDELARVTCHENSKEAVPCA